MVNLLTIGAVGAACFAAPLGYLAWKGGGFEIAFRWISVGSGADAGGLSLPERFAANFTMLWDQLWVWGDMLPILLGLGLLTWLGGRSGRVLIVACGAPLLVIMALGTAALPRHYVVALPLMLTLAGAGIGLGVKRLARRRVEAVFIAAIAGLVVVITDPVDYGPYDRRFDDKKHFPEAIQTQYVNDHSAGFGLREAVLDFPNVVEPPDAPIIASMFPDSCRRANFYAAPGYAMTCTHAPGREVIEAALREHGRVYVLVDTPPLIGVDVENIDAEAARIRGYPRPADINEDAASVVLWRLDSKPE